MRLMSERARIVLAIACFLTGTGLLVIFGSAPTRVAGVLLSVVAIVSAATAILTPSRLGETDDEATD